MPNLTPILPIQEPMSKTPVNQRPGAWGWFDEESVERNEPRRTAVDTPTEHLTPLVFNNVQVIENTTTQADSQTNGSIDFIKIDPLVHITSKTAEVTAEAVSDIFDIFKQVAGTGEYRIEAQPADRSQKKAEDEQKLKEVQMRIKEFQMQAKEAKQLVQAAERHVIEQTMTRTGVSQREVVSYEGSLTIANIFWIAIERTKQHAKKIASKALPGAGKGKIKGGTSLTMNLSAQEGQSMVSSSGSIASAG